MGWRKTTEMSLDEGVAGVSGTWRMRGERRHRNGFEPDREGLKAMQGRVGFFLRATGEPLEDFKQGSDSHSGKIVMAAVSIMAVRGTGGRQGV